MRLSRIAAVCALALAASACTTTSTIRTRPPGARVFVNGAYVGESPVEVELPDGLQSFPAGTSAKLELDGYETQNVLLTKSWSVGYLLLDGLLLLPTLGLSGYFAVFNGKTHESEYEFLMLKKRKPPVPAPALAPPARRAPAARRTPAAAPVPTS